MPVRRTLARSGTEVISRMVVPLATRAHRPRGVTRTDYQEHFPAPRPYTIAVPCTKEKAVDQRAQAGRSDGRYVRPGPSRSPGGRQRGGAHLRARRGHLRADRRALPEVRQGDLERRGPVPDDGDR